MAKDCCLTVYNLFMKSKILQILLVIVFTLDLFFIFNNNTELRFFAKPLLIPILMLIYVSKTQLEKLKLDQPFVIGLVLTCCAFSIN